MSILSISNHRYVEVLTIRERHATKPTVFVPTRETKADQDAYAAWMSGGSIGLGLWLARYKEKTTGRRNFTAEEYGRWVDDCRIKELRLTGQNEEFCTNS
jgi:hypothetical protein